MAKKGKTKSNDDTYVQNPLGDPGFTAAKDMAGAVASGLGDGAEGFNQAADQLVTPEYTGRLLFFTIVTGVKLLLENFLGCYFLLNSWNSCNEMKDAVTGCVGAFEECILPLADSMAAQSGTSVADCDLRADSNAEYAAWASTCSPRAEAFVMPVIAPALLSLALTVFFGVQASVSGIGRVRRKGSPRLNWKKNTGQSVAWNCLLIISSVEWPMVL